MGLLPRTRALLPPLLLATFVAVALTAGLPAPASAAACSGRTGVTVVVQFPDDHVEIGCATGDPATGLEALDKAGFPYEFVPRQPGAVCLIKRQPASRDCWQPPNSWSYWYAERGGSWTYSNYGAGNRDPKPGTVEGWVFGTKDKPRVAPPAAVAPSQKPKPTPTKRPKPKPSASTAVAAPKPSAPKPSAPASASPTARPSQSASPSASRSSSAASPSAVESPTADSTDGPATAGELVGSDPVSADEESSGGLSWVWGVGLVVLLGVAGAVTAIVRRKA